MPAPSIISGRVYYNVGLSPSRTVTSVNTTGGSLLLIKVASAYSDGSKVPTDVTFNGVSVGAAYAELDGGAGHAYGGIFRVVSPTQTTANVVVTFNADTAAVVIVEVWQDVDTVTPLGTAASASHASSTNATVDVSSATGETVTDLLAVRKGLDPDGTAEVGAGQTQIENQTSAADSTLAAIGASSYEAGAATVTMNWTLLDGNRWVVIGVSVKPGASGPPKFLPEMLGTISGLGRLGALEQL